MRSLVAADLYRSVRMRGLWVLAAAGVAVSLAFTAMSVYLFMPDAPTAQSVRDTYAMAGQGFLLAIFVGVVAMTGEYRHQTITRAFLVTPRRGQVIAAKFATCGLLGLAIGIAAAAASAGLAAAILAVEGAPVWAPGVGAVLLGSVVVTGMWAAFGAALGALVHNQVAAVTFAFLWFVYIEWFFIMLLPDVGRWVPSGASRAAIGWSRDGMVGFDGSPIPGALLPVWAGALLFAGYCLVLAVGARLTTIRRDVT